MGKLLTWIIIFFAGLLLGYIPQHWKGHGLRNELNGCKQEVDLAKVQRSGTLTYVAATQLNFGVASGYAQTFFAGAQKLQSTTSDPALKQLLTETLSTRDKISGDLARGSAEVVGELQPIVLRLEQSGQ